MQSELLLAQEAVSQLTVAGDEFEERAKSTEVASKKVQEDLAGELIIMCFVASSMWLCMIAR